MRKYIVWNIQKKEIEYLQEKEKEILGKFKIYEKYYIELAEEVVQ